MDNIGLFKKFPPELRNRIYHLAFSEPVYLLHSPTCTYERTHSATPGILLACRQIHQEAIGLYYNTSTFVAVGLGPSNTLRLLNMWLGWSPAKYDSVLTNVECRGSGELVKVCTDELGYTSMLGEFTHARKLHARGVIRVTRARCPCSRHDMDTQSGKVWGFCWEFVSNGK